MSTRQQGTLADWNDDRGFGFITPSAGGSRVFVHVSAFPRGPRPLVGSEVSYLETTDERNRARASQVQYVGARSRSRSRSRSTASGRAALTTAQSLAAAVAFFGLMVALLALDELPVTLLAAYALLSVIAFLMYGGDKAAAEQGTWRTSESALHAVALAGGWPGALVARPFFRHKTIKQPFRTIFWLTVVANCAVLAWFILNEPVTLP